MRRFSKIANKKIKENIEEDNSVIYENEHVKVTTYENWTILEEPNIVACIPYLIETNQIIIRQEYIPTFKKVEGSDYFLTCVAGKVEVGESNEDAMKRELEEEAGVVLRDGFQLEFEGPLFGTKATTSQYYFCIIPLTEQDYHEVLPTGDGSKEEKISKSIKVDLKYINHLSPADLVTELLLTRLRKYVSQ